MLRILALVLLSALISPSFADQRGETQRQLESAREDVAELKKLLEKIQQERSAVQQQLKKTERDMGDLENQVKELKRELNSSESEIKRLDAEKKKLQSARIEQQQIIAIQARAAYQSGSQEYLKLLLNQQNPEQVSRTLTYYDYLSRARLQQLAEFNETLRQLDNVEASINEHQAQLNLQKSELDSRHAALDKVRKERQQALNKLAGEVKNRDQRLQARQAEQQQLEKVLKTIEQTLARQAREAREAEQARQRELLALKQPSTHTQSTGPAVSSGATYGGPFAKARGKLPWPVNGRLAARYGTPRGDDSRTKWDGVLISAPSGSNVRAVHDGRVVFADWLRGAGLLVIVDHGNGYLSLYGHNQSLLKKAGDLVQAGENIATVGSSGGQTTPGLYFAIRQDGRPSDPAQWCRAQG